ncbi:hypothetical protein QYF61_021954 [Mycteria americana]|uniref:Uncharacterized protein n=1 Tax=Mycteria americana TaxID=33587 RepID=A0AAN7S9P2_MYCAM|nr:hypothetical protein QYF61_021954 [Mycteria americana]
MLSPWKFQRDTNHCNILGLAHAYRALFNTIQNPQGEEKVSGTDDKVTDEHIVTWLLQRWDNGASSLELEGREAKQMGSLFREGGIHKAIEKGAQVLSLWR